MDEKKKCNPWTTSSSYLQWEQLPLEKGQSGNPNQVVQWTLTT